MMMILFRVGDDRFGLNVVHVVEVIPHIPLQKVPKAPDYIKGLLNYRGEIIPVIDMGYLINECTAQTCLSSRIIIAQTTRDGHVGLLADQVTETLKVDDSKFTATKLDDDNGCLVDKVAIDSIGMIQHINPDVIVPEELATVLEEHGIELGASNGEPTHAV